jgi:hypothetical protein
MDTEIIQLALQNAKRYIPPDRETIYQRDWENQHSICTMEHGKLIYSDRTSYTIADEFHKDRRNIVKHFIETYVFPEEAYSCKLPFDINMHDFVATSMNNDQYPHSILNASLVEEDTHNIPIPDFYAMQGYHGSILETDPMPTFHKVNELYFIGTSTGNHLPYLNQRIKLCQFAQPYSWIHSYLSQVVQVTEYDLYHYDPTYQNYIHPHVFPRYQKMYRHLISVDGNTAAWDRVPWIMASNSVLWKCESKHMCWYYPLLKPWNHYIPFEIETLETTWNYRKHDIPLCTNIVYQANQFVQDVLHIEKHALYMRTLLEEIKYLYEP